MKTRRTLLALALLALGTQASCQPESTSGEVSLLPVSTGPEAEGAQLQSAAIEPLAGGTRLRLRFDRRPEVDVEHDPRAARINIELPAGTPASSLEQLVTVGTLIESVESHTRNGRFQLAAHLSGQHRVRVVTPLQDTELWIEVLASEDPSPAPSAAKVVRESPPAAIDRSARTGVTPGRSHASADRMFLEALRLERQGKMGEVAKGLAEALELDPNHHEAREHLARVLAAHRQHQGAIRVLRQGLEVSPYHPKFSRMLARLLVDQGAVAVSVQLLEESLAHSNDLETRAFLAALLQREGSHERAVELYRMALEERPLAGGWWLGLAISLDAQRENDAALAAFESALATGSLDQRSSSWVRTRVGALKSDSLKSNPQ